MSTHPPATFGVERGAVARSACAFATISTPHRPTLDTRRGGAPRRYLGRFTWIGKLRFRSTRSNASVTRWMPKGPAIENAQASEGKALWINQRHATVEPKIGAARDP